MASLAPIAKFFTCRYLPLYPLVCLAAQYSQRAYIKPTGKEREAHVDANWRMGTKAMVIKSVPIDDMNTIIFAIRGSQTFMDWAVNLNSAPVSPSGFLVRGRWCVFTYGSRLMLFRMILEISVIQGFFLLPVK